MFDDVPAGVSVRQMGGMGHEDPFPPYQLNAGYPFN
jgi:hypothetical protein